MKAISLLLLTALWAGEAPRPKPKIAVVIDDFGLTYPKNVPDEKWMKVPFRYTAAVMPESPRTRQAARQLQEAGKEVIIHFPFDPFLPLELPRDAASEQDVYKVRELLRKSVRDIPQAVGVNNHRSYNATQNAPLMRAVMPMFKDRGYYFLDSRVSPRTVAYAEAKAAGLKSAVNDVFLDEAKRHDKKFCMDMLRRAARLARKRGYAIAIGHHYFWGTYEGLLEMVPQLEKEGFEFVFASELAR